MPKEERKSTGSRGPRGRMRVVEKPKNFSKAIKRLFLELKDY